jgi:hypothetical protein
MHMPDDEDDQVDEPQGEESPTGKDSGNVKGKILEKALGPAAEEFGERIRPVGRDAADVVVTVTKTAKVLLAPVRAVVWGADKIEAWLNQDVEDRLKNVPEHRRRQPDLNIAGPTVDAMRYVGEVPELRNMFANLLASAMDAETADWVHPAFVEVIKQLCPDEAKILEHMSTGVEVPVIDVRETDPAKPSDGYEVLRQRFSNIADAADCQRTSMVSTYLDNLCRLELCRNPTNTRLTDEKKYEPLENSELVSDLRASVRAKGLDIEIHQGIVHLTEFGKQFVKVCVIKKD